jgi:hypothetical protein
MRTTVNRLLLFLVGLILIIVGASVLFGALDLARHWDFAFPGWWPYKGPHDVLLTAHGRTRYRADHWWWPAVIATLAALTLIALWWLVAQARSRRLGRVVVDYGYDGRVILRGRALQDALAADAEALPGVVGAGVRLVGRRTAPTARMSLVLDGEALPDEVVAGLDSQVLADARHSTGLAELPAVVRLHGEHHRARRVE